MREQAQEPSTQELNAKYLEHVQYAKAPGAKRRYHMLMARGYYMKLKERALAGDDDVLIGAPHWISYSDEQMAQVLR